MEVPSDLGGVRRRNFCGEELLNPDGALLFVCAKGHKVRYSVSTDAHKAVLKQLHRRRATSPGGKALLVFLENALGNHSFPFELEMVVIAWHRYSKRHLQFSKERWGYRSFFVPSDTEAVVPLMP